MILVNFITKLYLTFLLLLAFALFRFFCTFCIFFLPWKHDVRQKNTSSMSDKMEQPRNSPKSPPKSAMTVNKRIKNLEPGQFSTISLTILKLVRCKILKFIDIMASGSDV
jgi:hypothetical protein